MSHNHNELASSSSSSGNYGRGVITRSMKRRYVEPLADENPETTICTVEEEQVLKQSVSIKKAHKPKAISSDESDGKKERRDKKKQQHKQQQQHPKAKLPQLTNEPSSSRKMHDPCQDGGCAGTSACDDTGSVLSTKQRSTVEEEQALKQSVSIEKAHKPKAMSTDEPDGKKERRDLPQLTNEPSSSRKMHDPCQDGACPGTSACDDTGSVLSTKQRSLHELFLEELRKSSNNLEYDKVLQGTEFTEEQIKILRQSFTQLSRKMFYINKNSERFRKTHKCMRCEFSISHQCMPLDYIRSVPFGTELMDQECMRPKQTVVCGCGFGFSHVHLKRTPRPPQLSFAEMYIPHLEVKSHSCDVSCKKCYTNIVMNSNSAHKVCCDLATWDCIAGDNREMFYAGIKNCFHYSGTTALSLDEFSACSKGCCLLFHRCFEKVEAPGASSSSPGCLSSSTPSH